VREPGPLTPAEWIHSEQVVSHAMRRGKAVASHRHVRAVIHCNQPDARFKPCDWSRTIESRTVDLDSKVERALRTHFVGSHPTANADLLLAARHVLLHDI